ncbi:dephospho-CoA kinase [Alkalibaculum sp. M08DMB]|uniref:Dephospho-CoA kinase n=1 Tax=Alkalibaculum sporogenes TaxID=2655001 RepID=A0A6A7K6S8_9FIRM|nr:dephospho-CoA kinase [Alkalibaculum sporogenes]MPW24823.1 dephospho-CoA kinase [Alkalibaculum sporogenes]
MKIYGLTGGIATGKSTVSTILNSELHVKVIDADVLARKSVEPGSIGLEKIVGEFGRELLLPDKSLNRKKLGDIVFGNQELIKVLNGIVHPEVELLFEEQVQKYKEKRYRAIVYDCPLLIEEKLIHKVDQIILVVTSEKLQLERLMNRNNLSREEAVKRISAQMKMDDKSSFANYIIYNDGNYTELKNAVIHLWEEIIDKN